MRYLSRGGGADFPNLLIIQVGILSTLSSTRQFIFALFIHFIYKMLAEPSMVSFAECISANFVKKLSKNACLCNIHLSCFKQLLQNSRKKCRKNSFFSPLRAHTEEAYNYRFSCNAWVYGNDQMNHLERKLISSNYILF